MERQDLLMTAHAPRGILRPRSPTTAIRDSAAQTRNGTNRGRARHCLGAGYR